MADLSRTTDRDELAEILHKAVCGCSLWGTCSTEPDHLYHHVAGAVLASVWLVEHDVSVRRRCLEDAANDLQVLKDSWRPELSLGALWEIGINQQSQNCVDWLLARAAGLGEQ